MTGICRDNIQAVEHRAFRATWKLVEAIYNAYDPGFWYTRDLKADNLSILPITRRTVSLCTTGAVVLFAYGGIPKWIETPWGEWNCFWGLQQMSARRYLADEAHPLARACAGFAIEQKSSRCNYETMQTERSHIRWNSDIELAFQNIDGIELPSRVSKPAIFNARGHAEWVAMCMYYHTVYPKYSESIFQWLHSATEEAQSVFNTLD